MARYKPSDRFIRAFFLHLYRYEKREEKQAIEYAREVERFARHLERSYTVGDFTNLYRASSQDVLEYMDYLERELNLKATTINRKVSFIHTFFEFGIEKHGFRSDPTVGVPRLDEVPTAAKTLNALEIKKILDQAKRVGGRFRWLAVRDVAMLHVLFLGVAKKEIENLKIDDFNPRAATLQVGTGRKRRTVDLTDVAVEAIEAYRRVRLDYDGIDALFVAKSRKPLSGRQIWCRLRDLGKAAGINVPTNAQLIKRSSVVNELIEDPGRVFHVQRRLGHSSLSSTEKFASQALALKRKAAGMDGLVAGDLSSRYDAKSRTLVLQAIDKYLSSGATRSQRRDAVRDLGDVLEHYRDEAKALLGPDESDLFHILNRFNIRHHNETQKDDYDPIWLSALFYHYLNMIHVLGSLMDERDGQKPVVA